MTALEFLCRETNTGPHEWHAFTCADQNDGDHWFRFLPTGAEVHVQDDRGIFLLSPVGFDDCKQ